ncbi:MAG: hypothetical protein AB1523_00620 [Bacillota bacterium]
MAKSKLVRIKKDVPETWEHALQWFLNWKQAQSTSKRTLNDYRYHISLFYQRFPDTYLSDKLMPAVLEHAKQVMKPAKYNLRLVYLRAFFS